MDSLAKLQPDASAVISVGKSRWKIVVFFLLILLYLLSACISLVGFWGSVPWQILFIAIFALPALSLGVQLVQVVQCKPPLLALELEGLRVNFTGDFIRYEQIDRVGLSLYQWAMNLTLVSKVPLKLGTSAYGVGWFFGRTLVLNDFYAISISDLVGEIERRKKVLEGGRPLKENETGADAAFVKRP